MNALQQWHRQLVLCAMHRAGAPRKADAELLDAVVALALDAGAQPEEVADLDCRKLAAALRGLEQKGNVMRVGMERDARQGRDVPTYCATGPCNRNAEPPKPPRPDPAHLTVLGLRQGNALARKLGAKPTPKVDRQLEQVNELFREMASDQAGALVRIQKEIDAIRAKYAKRYQQLLGKALEEPVT
jgi:hypothetical protein